MDLREDDVDTFHPPFLVVGVIAVFSESLESKDLLVEGAFHASLLLLLDVLRVVDLDVLSFLEVFGVPTLVSLGE